MAPEQFAGKGASVRSDIYALGLILYETYCGKPAFSAATIAELREQKEAQIPTAPSRIREGVDPFVERLIMRPIAPIDFKPPADLPSCGAQFGTIQWHADGSVVALGPDHPVTGGYLQPATVVSTELWKLAQLAPGDRVKLIAV